MKTQIFKTAVLMLAMLASTACSNQWRESGDTASAEEAFEFVNSVGAASLAGLAEDDSSAVYFAQSGSGGLAESVMSFGDVGFLIPEQTGYNVFDIGLTSVTVALVDGYVNGARQFALIIKYESAVGSDTFSEVSSDYSLSDKKFEVRFPARNGGTLLLRSYDVDKSVKDELAGTIHVKAYMIDSSGEYQIGQFSSLRGFGG